MIIAYHAIFTTYGTWLPNDPRGSYSKEIYNEELLAAAAYVEANPKVAGMPPQCWDFVTPLSVDW